MSQHAVAQETVVALRRTIARIEGRLPGAFAGMPAGQRHDDPSCDPAGGGQGTAAGYYGPVVRQRGVAIENENAGAGMIVTGVQAFDQAMGGGLPLAALSEIHTAETRDAGAAAGFVLGLVRCAGSTAPVIWIGTADTFGEAGFPHAPGAMDRFGLEAQKLFVCTVPRIADALWVAEEAAGRGEPVRVIVELRGRHKVLDLTATRRLHRRAAIADCPVFLIRHAAGAQPTAAPFRLVVAPAPAARRMTLAGPLSRSVGAARFAVTIDKGRTACGGQFILEWNHDENRFRDGRSTHPGTVLSPSADRQAQAPALRPAVAPASDGRLKAG